MIHFINRMRGFYSILAALCFALGAWGATSGTNTNTVTQGVTGRQAPKAAPSAVQPATPIPPLPKTEPPDNTENALRQRIAQLMFVTLGGLGEPDTQDRELLVKSTPGGVIIPVLRTPKSAADYINTVRSLANEKRNNLGLFIATDLYGLPRHENNAESVFVQLPTPMAIAAAASTTATEKLARLSADHLQAMGFNVCLGPALDLAPTLNGAKGTLQTFGTNPAFIADVAGTFAKTLAAQNLLAMPTGFPGGSFNRLGNSPATLLTPRARYLEEDGLPYARAIEAGVKLIHVAPTLVTGYDETSRPACLSKGIMNELLRTQLKYEGLVIAGPMDSPDIERLIDPQEAAVTGLGHGADMILWKANGPRINKAVETILLAIREGRLSEETINQAWARVEAVKKAAGLIDRPPVDPGKAEALSKKRTYADEAYAIERQSITLIKNRASVLPLQKDKSLPVGITGIVGVEGLKDILEKRLKQVVMQPIDTARHTGGIEDFEITRLTTHSGGLRTVICIFNDTLRIDGALRLVGELKKMNAQVVVVLLGHPKTAPQFKEADAIVLAYSYDADCTQSIRAVADILTGDAPPHVLPGKRPIKVQAAQPARFNAMDLISTPGGTLPVALSPEFPAGFSVSYDSANGIQKAIWNFGDGEETKGEQPEHVYKAPGQYTLTLTITGAQDEIATGTFQVIAE